MTEETLFERVVQLSAGERAAFLDRECAGQPELRGRVEALLAADAASHSPLDHPVAAPEQTGEYTPAPAGQQPASRKATDQHPDSQAGAVVAEKYTLVEAIGEGGMGAVWRAKQTEPVKRFVAVKLIKAGMDSKQVLARFDAERQALALMDHPNIAKVLDGGLHDHRPFFVMELVKGVPVTEYCDANKLTPQQRLELFVQACQAIQHAHQKGIIHRDIKPSNVLVALYDDRPVVKVIDFGVAKATGGTLTEATIDTGIAGVVGTPQYMSPEQATFNNLDIDTRSDVYALGVLLYELLAGSPPFSGEELKKKGLMEILRVVREEEPPRPSTKLSTADALPSLSANRGTEPKKLTGLLRNELDWIVMKALEKDRTRRYETANGFAADVQRYLAGEPVMAHPPSMGYRLKKFVRRNKGQVVAASLVLMVLIGGVVGTSVGLLEANAAAAKERSANANAQTARTEAENAAKAEAAAKIEALNAAAKERTAREREATQRAAAEKARDRTRDVLDAMVSEVTGDSLATQKEISPEQKKFLENVLGYYREFAGENPDDERSRARHSEAAYRVGQIESRLGRKQESAAAYRLARDGYASLAAEFPAVPGYRERLAGSHYNQGNQLQDLGQSATAEEQVRKALAIQEKLAADFPAVSKYRSGLADSHNSLGNLLADLGQRTAAEEQYRNGLAILEKLAADFPAVPEYRRSLAVIHNSLGVLLRKIGQGAGAEEQYRKALAIQEKLAAEFPAVPEYRERLAGSHHNLGIVLKNCGQGAAAEEPFRKALAIREKLVAEFPAVPRHRLDLAASNHSLGNLLYDLGRLAAAEEPFRKALAIQEKLAADFPAVPEYRDNLRLSHNGLGTLLLRQRKRPEAAEQYRKALAIQEKLAAEFPAVPGYQIALGGSCCNFGNLILAGGDPAESLKWFGRAIDCLQSIHEKEPRDFKARQFLMNSHLGRAQAYQWLKKYPEAVKDWDRVIALCPPTQQLPFRERRATVLLKVGMVAEAVAEVAELTKSSNWEDVEWFELACVYSVASGKIADKKAEYADRAMELLQKAVKAGYRDAAHMKKDTDLDPLREREDFKKLFGDLEKKFPPMKEVPPRQDRKN